MKDVLIVMDSLQCGGAEKSLVTLLHSIRQDCYRIDLALNSRGGEFERSLPAWVNVIDIPRTNNRFLVRCLSLTYSIAWRWMKLIGRKVNLSQLHWQIAHRMFVPLSKTYDLAIGYQQGLPSYHVIDKVRAVRKFCWINTDLMQASHNAEYERRYYDQADMAIAVSGSLRDRLIDTGYVDPNRVRVFKDRIDAKQIREMSCACVSIDCASKYLIVMVGRLSREKNHSLAIEVADNLKTRGVDFTLLIIGEGVERKSLESMIASMNLDEQVKLIGYKDNPYPYIRACDVFLHTSHYEGFGISLAEAKLLGCKIVATDIPSLRDQIEDYPDGALCPFDKEAITEQIIRMLG